jgi:hypothetical protein
LVVTITATFSARSAITWNINSHAVFSEWSQVTPNPNYAAKMASFSFTSPTHDERG